MDNQQNESHTESSESPKSKHLIPQSREEWVERGVDKLKDKIQDKFLVEPAVAALKTAGEGLVEQATFISASQGSLAANIARGAGQAAVQVSEAYELGSAAISTASMYAALAGAEGYAVYKATTAIDEHTGHAITNSAPAKAWGAVQEKIGADERLWYAQQAKDSFDAKHPDASPLASGVAWAKAAFDPHMADNHALSLQQQMNSTLMHAGRHDALISLDEAKLIHSAIVHAKGGDKILVDRSGNVELASGTPRHAIDPTTTVFDASTLRMASTIRYESAEHQASAAVSTAQTAAGRER